MASFEFPSLKKSLLRYMRTSCITQIQHKQNLGYVVLLLRFRPKQHAMNATEKERSPLDTGYNVSVT